MTAIASLVLFGCLTFQSCCLNMAARSLIILFRVFFSIPRQKRHTFCVNSEQSRIRLLFFFLWPCWLNRWCVLPVLVPDNANGLLTAVWLVQCRSCMCAGHCALWCWVTSVLTVFQIPTLKYSACLFGLITSWCYYSNQKSWNKMIFRATSYVRALDHNWCLSKNVAKWKNTISSYSMQVLVGMLVSLQYRQTGSHWLQTFLITNYITIWMNICPAQIRCLSLFLFNDIPLMRKVWFAWSQNKGETSVTVVSQIPPSTLSSVAGGSWGNWLHGAGALCQAWMPFSQCIARNKGTLLKPS